MNKIIKRSPSHSLVGLIDEFFNIGNVMGSDMTHSVPSVNIAENDHAYILSMAAPGLKKDEFNISLEHDKLFVSSMKSTNDSVYTKREYDYNGFKRSFNLSKDIDRNEITASYDQGILEITLPKIQGEVEQKVKRIEIG